MKVIWTQSSPPEFQLLNRKERAQAWKQVFSQVREFGMGRYMLITGVAIMVVMLIGIHVINRWIPELDGILAMGVLGGIGGYFGGVLSSTFMYRDHRQLFTSAATTSEQYAAGQPATRSESK